MTRMPLKDMETLIKSFGPNTAGIVYCWKREECDMLALAWLDTFKISGSSPFVFLVTTLAWVWL